MLPNGPKLALLCGSLALLVACEAAPSLGTPCTRPSECSAPLTCAFGRCRTSCTLNRDCPVGSVCRLDESGTGSCAIADDPGCGPSAPCTGGLLCVDRMCVNGCTTVAECPADSECVAGEDGRTRCVREDVIDAGIDDASVTPDGGDDCIVGPPCDPIVQIGVGAEHACARASSGAVWCWGVAQNHELAQETPTTDCYDGVQCSPVPVRIPYRATDGTGEIATAIDLSVSAHNACAVLRGDVVPTQGEVVCWGVALSHQLGDAMAVGAPAQRVRLDDATTYLDRDVVSVDLGGSFAATFHASGRHYGWGDDVRGPLRLDGGVHAGATELAPLADQHDFAFGSSHGCALVGTGELAPWCWGGNDDGQSGGGGPFTETAVVAPTLIEAAGLGPVVDIDAGAGHSCALTATGDVWCWGNGYVDGSATMPSCPAGLDRPACPPARVFRPGADPFRLLGESGTNASCALDERGRVWCWGEFGPTLATSGGDPERIGDDVEGVTAVAIGDTVGCLITQDGDVMCWGANYNGQLGRGATSTTNDLTPQRVIWPRAR